MLATWGNSTGIKPTLDLQFAGATSLDSRITFSRGSQATYFDSTGTLRWAANNVVTYSEQFDNVIWVKTGGAVTPNTTVAPDGNSTADSFIEDTSTGGHNVVESATFQDYLTVTASVYVKANGRSWVAVSVADKTGANNRVWFNVSTGVQGTTNGTVSAFSAVDVGNGWYRISVSASVSTGAQTPGLRVSMGSADNTASYTGNGVSGIYLWGAQFNAGAAQPYNLTTSAAYYGPRLDYNPSTLAPLGLLIEEQRTNSIRNSTMVGASAPSTIPTNWLSNVGGLTLGVVGTGTENGITYIDIRFSGTPSQTFANVRFDGNTQIVAANGQTWTSSFYARMVAGSTTNIGAVENRIQYRDSGGTSVFENASDFASTISAVSLSVARRNYTLTSASASTAFINSAVSLTTTIGVAIDITLRIGLPQLELGAFATSVIPTTTTALTRNADVATMTGTNFSSWYNASAGTLYAQAIPTLSGIRVFVSANSGANTNALNMYWTTTVQNQVNTGGVQQALLISSATTPFKSAFAYATNDFSASVNAGAIQSSSSGTVPTVNQLTVGALAGGSVPLNGWLQRISYYPTRLANSTLQALTA